MKNRILSLLLSVIMLVTLCSPAITAFAAETNQYVITANKSEAQPGETITYSVTMGPAKNVYAMGFSVVVPEGLTYVSGSAKVSDVLTACVNESGELAEFEEKTMMLQFADNDMFSKDTDTVVLTFECTVNENAFGTYSVEIDPISVSILDGETWEEIVTEPVNNARVTVCSHTKTELQNQKEATCTTEGYTGDTVCTECGKKMETGVKIDKNTDNHVEIKEVAKKDATCTEAGNHAYSFCTGCGVTTDGDSTPIPAPGHKAVEGWGKDETNHWQVCDVCGEKFGETAHVYEAATCQKPQTCVCGATISGVVEHSFTKYVDNKSATCTENATQIASCDYDCGATNEIEVEGTMLPHNYSETLKYDENQHWKQCEDCGNKTEIAAHDYGDGDTCKCGYERNHVHRPQYVAEVPATCTREGVSVHYACPCGAKFKDEAALEAVTDDDLAIKKLEHVFETYVSDGNGTCTANGTETAQCKNGCGTEDQREKADSKVPHKFVTYVSNKDGTCTANGTETAECEYDCGTEDTREKADSKVPHKFENYVSDKNGTCTANGTETAKCEYGCGETDEREEANSKIPHSFTKYVSNDDATCTKNASETAQCDYECGASDIRTIENSMKPHNYEWQKDEEGHWQKCSVCNHETEKEMHNAGDEGFVCKTCGQHVHRPTLVPPVEATCTTGGKLAYYVCPGCNAWFEDRSGSVEITNKDSVNVAALGHSYNNYVSKGDATCTEDGTETAKCDRCDVTDTRTDVGSKLGHSFKDYKSNNNATCTADGTKTAKCEREGCKATDTVTDVNSKLGHEFKDYKSDENATCTEDGTKTSKCSRCDMTNTITDEGSKKGHDVDEDAKWKWDDYKHWKECNVCDDHAEEENHKASPIRDENGRRVCSICGAIMPERAAVDDIPKTSDNSNTALWTSLIAVSAMGIAVCLLLGKKRKTV